MPWSIADIADAVESRLKQRVVEESLEQVVYGFDSRDELGLHPLIQESLHNAEYGVWPEQRYPSEREKRRRSEGKRCDIVLTPAPEALPLRDPLVKDTLFDQQPAIDPTEAYWLEIKSVAQFEPEGPFRGYSSELFSPVPKDVKKLWTDPLIYHGGLLLLLFTECELVATHDLKAWHERCMEKGFPVSPPAARGFAIPDRIGNGWCQIAVFGVRG